MPSKKLSEHIMGWLGDGLNSDSLASPGEDSDLMSLVWS